MQLPGTPSLFFLAYLFAFLPWVAFRGARVLRDARNVPPRTTIWTRTLVSQLSLLALAWLTGRSFDHELFAVPALGAKDFLAATIALAACFVLRSLLRAVRSEAERRKLSVYAIAPRTAPERALCIATILVGSVAEEAAYRGIGMSILWYSLGNPWLAALLCAAAFAAAHWTQGAKSAAAIFGIALMMHGLVAFTNTLVLAVVVHAAYDLVAGHRIARDAARLDAESAGAP